MNKKTTVVFSCLALREIEFFVDCAKEMQRSGVAQRFHFISFFEPGNSIITDAGFTCHNFYRHLGAAKSRSMTDTLHTFGFESEGGEEHFERLLLHEKVTFGIRDTDRLKQKFFKYLWAADEILRSIQTSENDSKIYVFEELGGFLACLSVFYAARRLGLPHGYFEPSFYKGRIIAVWNTLGTVRPNAVAASNVDVSCRDYLTTARSKRVVVIPQKDRHHFLDMGLRKLVNSRNLRQLSQKITNKYLLGKRFEFDHIWNHSTRSLKMLANRKRRSGLYETSLETIGRGFVYFPLHVELDYSLTIRSPEWLDQIGVLRKIAEVLPSSVKLVAKEHPASIGGFDQRAVHQLLRDFPQVHLMHPSMNSYDLLDRAGCVITINSKVGAEALLLKKPVVVLGDSFYAGSKIVLKAKRFAAVPNLIKEGLSGCHEISDEDLEGFFGGAWRASFEGELYVQSKDNVSLFTKGLAAEMEKV